MSLDRFMDKAKCMLSEHEGEVYGAVDKVADAAQAKTPDQHDGVVDSAAQNAKDAL